MISEERRRVVSDRCRAAACWAVLCRGPWVVDNDSELVGLLEANCGVSDALTASVRGDGGEREAYLTLRDGSGWVRPHPMVLARLWLDEHGESGVRSIDWLPVAERLGR